MTKREEVVIRLHNLRWDYENLAQERRLVKRQIRDTIDELEQLDDNGQT